jgi:hypothetical protein
VLALIAQLAPVPGDLAAIDADGRVLARARVQEQMLEVDVPVGSSGVPAEGDYLLHARADLPVRVPATISP